ncbi:ligase [Ktedonobacteria bacterium brp13]|nr:ligase [Ktedonobacteria bacterium brp13]
MSNWLIYPLTIADQQQHIEFSEHLLSTIQPGDPAILYWSIADPTGLVLGFSQKETVVNPAALSAGTLPLYHRHAGGTAVLVGPTLLSLDVILPAGHPLILADIVESYRWFGEAWVTALAQLGIQTHLVQPEQARAQRELRKQPETREYELLMNRACYGSLSSYEVVVEQRKVVGLDMIRRRCGSMLQAGVLLSWDTSMLAHLLGHTPEEQTQLQKGLKQRAVGLDSLAGRVIEIEEVITAFEDAVIADARLRMYMHTI